MGLDILSWVAVALGFASIAYLVVLAGRRDHDRDHEDDARAFFDAHGRWPDEPADAAVPRAGGYGDVDRLG